MNRAEHWGRLLLALACVLLVVVLGTAQVAHAHSDGNQNHADCALCLTAHITAQPAFAPAPVPTTRVITAVEAVPTTTLPRTLAIFALFTRPPPAC